MPWRQTINVLSIVVAVACVWARVANLAFLKPDFEILFFLNTFGFFRKSEKDRQNLAFSGFFLVGKPWLCKNNVWAAYLLQISSEESV